MKKEIMEALEAMNLSDKEISVYVSLLELGNSSVNKITLKSGLNRVTVYPVLKSLIKKGFVSSFQKDNISFFRAIEPKNILGFIKEKEKKVKNALPHFREIMQTVQNDSSVELFKGSKGIVSLMEIMYSGEDKIVYNYGRAELINNILKFESANARRKRIDSGIRANVVTNRLKSQYMNNKGFQSLTKIHINEKLDSINIFVIVGSKKIAIFEGKNELNGFLVRNKEVAYFHKFIFELLKNQR